MTSAQTLIGVGVLVALVSLLADRLRLGGILALGGYRKLGLSSAAWRSWPASICEAGRLGRPGPAAQAELQDPLRPWLRSLCGPSPSGTRLQPGMRPVMDRRASSALWLAASSPRRSPPKRNRRGGAQNLYKPVLSETARPSGEQCPS